MRTLQIRELQAVNGGVANAKGGKSDGGFWQWLDGVWHDVENYFEGSGGGGSQACNSLGRSLGATSHIPGLNKADGAELGRAGSICNQGARAVNGGTNNVNSRYNQIGDPNNHKTVYK